MKTATPNWLWRCLWRSLVQHCSEQGWIQHWLRCSGPPLPGRRHLHWSQIPGEIESVLLVEMKGQFISGI